MPQLRATIVFTLLAGVLFAGPAEAGRRPFTWVYDTEVLPERGVEIETWVTDRVQRTPRDTTDLWWAPVVGVTDRLEVALPVEVGWRQDKGTTQVLDYGIDVRYRFASPDPVEAGPLVPYLRLGAYRTMANRQEVKLQGDFVLGLDLGERWHLAGDLGGTCSTDTGSANLIYGAGLAFKAREGVQLGAEWWGIDALRNAPKGFDGLDVLGPTVGWTHGRTWITLGVMFGLGEGSPHGMGRLLWAIAW